MRPCIGHGNLAVVLVIFLAMSCRNHEPKAQPTTQQALNVSVQGPAGSLDRETMTSGISRDPSYPFKNAPPGETPWTNQGVGYPANGTALRRNPWRNQDPMNADRETVTINFRSDPEAQDLHSSVKSWQESIDDFKKSVPADFVEDPRPVLDESSLQIP
jgi:hypothetical protein